MSEDSRFSEFPEVITFEGVGRASLKQIHIIALSLVILGVIFAILAPPGGYILLIIFILIAAGYDVLFIRKSQKPVRLSLHLRTDPVEATYDDARMGEIKSGTIVTDMDNANELGFRPAPNKELLVWKFDSEEDAKAVAKRLSMYLQVES
ncbi:MAG: hypothetical protein JRN52_04225 [Nitrososphaerota archaeon]|nr:hypothetical protein [Nitrososphaerota archaeon]